MEPVLIILRGYLITTEECCPECLIGELDTGRECNICSYDANPEYTQYLEFVARVKNYECR